MNQGKLIENSAPIGILGGTGPEGSGLALRFGLAGYSVIIGSRSAENARVKAQTVQQRLEQTDSGGTCSGKENVEVASLSRLLLLTAPFEHASKLLDSCQDAIQDNTILIDATVPLLFKSRTPEVVELAEGSGSQFLAQFLPKRCQIVACFKTIPAHVLLDTSSRLDCCEFVCGDSPEAKAQVIEILSHIHGLRPLDAGPLKMAGTLEQMTVLAITLNQHYKTRSSRFSIVGF